MKQAPEDEIGILKSIWKKNAAGVWVGHDLQGIDLNPREGFSKDYFKIKNEVNLMTQRPGPIMSNFFATFGTTEFLVRQSIVPIVAWNDGDEEIRCIGTGFFISASGLLMTAAQVLRDGALNAGIRAYFGHHTVAMTANSLILAGALTFIAQA